MSGTRVLVIEDDDAVARLLVTCLRRAGLEAERARDGLEGLAMARASVPDCIVCDVHLPGRDGFAVAASVRASDGPLAATPFLFLTALEDDLSRERGFAAGGDVYMTKPFRVAEVVSQVRALVAMCRRVRAAPAVGTVSSLPPASPPPALRGDLAQMAIASVLTVLDLEQRSGALAVASAGHTADLAMSGGVPFAARLDGADAAPLDVVRTIVGWSRGTFVFRSGERRPVPAGAAPLRGLLLDAMRLLDEASAPSSELTFDLDEPSAVTDPAPANDQAGVKDDVSVDIVLDDVERLSLRDVISAEQGRRS